jgi:hypothetical protein
MTRAKLTRVNDEILTEFYGHVPQWKINAVALIHEEKPVAVVGMVIQPNGLIMFSEWKEDMKRFARDLIIAMWCMLGEARKFKMPILAVRHSNQSSHGLLSHFGFVPFKGEVYIWRG